METTSKKRLPGGLGVMNTPSSRTDTQKNNPTTMTKPATMYGKFFFKCILFPNLLTICLFESIDKIVRKHCRAYTCIIG